MKILIIGDSWIDYLPVLNKKIFTVCCIPGASVFELKNYLEIELATCTYDKVLVIGGKNGYDKEILGMHPNLKLLRNDLFADEYLLSDKTHPSEKCIKKVLKIINSLV